MQKNVYTPEQLKEWVKDKKTGLCMCFAPKKMWFDMNNSLPAVVTPDAATKICI